jgi:hypothetical protein
MKLSEYAKQVGVTYKTAYQWWKAGQLDAYQLPTGTIIVREPKIAAMGAALYARVSSAPSQCVRCVPWSRAFSGLRASGHSVPLRSLRLLAVLLAD